MAAPLTLVSVDLFTRTLLVSRNSRSPALIRRTGALDARPAIEWLDAPSEAAGIHAWTKPTIAELPLEAGLGHTHISHTKGCYVGQEIIHRIYSRGHTNRELTGFVAHAEFAPSRLEKVYGLGAEPGKEIGWITSVTDSPAVGAFILLGYLRHEYRESATQLASGSGIPLTVHELPFYRRP